MLKSRDLYRVLGREMAPWAKRRGAVRQGSAPRWRCDLPGELRLEVELQADKNGWTTEAGGRFTINLVALEGTARLLDARFDRLLDARDRAAMRPVLAAVRAKLADDDDDHDDDDDYSELWLPFFDANDVQRWWSDFLEPRFEELEARFLRTGGCVPTPLATVLPVPSLSVSTDVSPGRTTVVVALQDAAALARALRAESDVVIVRQPELDAVFEKNARSRTGTARTERLGIAQRSRVWFELGPRALAELLDVLDAGQAVNDRVIGAAARLDLTLTKPLA